MMDTRAFLLVFGLSTAVPGSIGGCGGSSDATRSSSTPRSEQGAQTPQRGKIACRLHSCAAPYFCNEQTGICERLSCEDTSDCPYAYKCDHSVGVCR